MKKKLLKYLADIDNYCLEDIVEDVPYAMNRVYDYYIDVYGAQNGGNRFWSMFLAGISIDGNITDQEVRFLQELIKGYAHAGEWIMLINNLSCSEESFMAEFGELPHEIQTDFVYLMISVCAVDGRIGKDENAFLRRILKKI